MKTLKCTLAALTLAITTCMAGPSAQAQSNDVLQLPIPTNAHCQLIDSYRSQKLQATFLLQRMQIPGFSVFWGARVVSVQPGSPLQQIGLKVGDVVTRLDGVPIHTGKYKVPGQIPGTTYWAIPQMEKHYSITQVRCIKAGSIQVQNRTADLGPHFPIGNPVGDIVAP